MLRNRPRAVTRKQALMADHSSQSSSTQNYTKPITSFFGSPRFKAFTQRVLIDTEALKSPTSILDNKPFFLFGNPFGYDIINQPKSPKVFSPNNKQHSPENIESKGIGLAIVDTLNNKLIENEIFSETSNKKVLFETEQLRVQIPPLLLCLVSPTTSPKSPTNFGIKTRNSHLSTTFSSPNSSIHTKDSPFTSGSLDVREMKLSEDYIRVISYGPNPKTTHIFDNCIVENNCSVFDKPKTAPESFLSFCQTCNKNLEQKIEINIYRGEKAYCNQECRYQELRLHGKDN
ncbi:hypothetical protein PTKIN_Ptkin12aG0117300 [Pterospermum kingtungense]